MTSSGERPFPLDYAPEIEAGDVVATRRLAAIAKWILIAQLAVLAFSVVIGLVEVSRTPNLLGWWTAYGLATSFVEVYLMIRCIKVLAHDRKAALGIFYVTLLVKMLQPLVYQFVYFSRLSAAGVAIGSMMMIVFAIQSNCHVMMVPSLLRRDSGEWLRRLHWLAVAMLTLSLVNWFRNIAISVLDGTLFHADSVEVIKPTWLQTGVLASIALLVALRHENNRILIRLVAAWYVLFSLTILHDAYWHRIYPRRIDSDTAMNLIDESLRLFVGGLPLAFLVWFTFRFTDAQRKEMGAVLADRPANA